jgi:hypothetical protein
MQKNNVSPSRRAPRTDAGRRGELMAAFERSGLSAAEFARQHGIHYPTFCGWRRQRDRVTTAPAFVQVKLAATGPPPELVIEVGAARLRLISAAQVPLAARLLQLLQEGPRC